MKRMYILMSVLLATGFLRGDASLTRVQDPLVVSKCDADLHAWICEICR